MRCLTLTQPWATLVAMGAKRIETRSWTTNYRGPLAIHAGKGPSTIGWPQLNHICNHTEPFRSVLQLDGRHPAEVLPLGAIVAVVELHSVHRITAAGVEGFAPQPPAHEIAFGNYTPGRFAWVLLNVSALETPIPVRGGLGLWDWTPPEGFAL